MDVHQDSHDSDSQLFANVTHITGIDSIKMAPDKLPEANSFLVSKNVVQLSFTSFISDAGL